MAEELPFDGLDFSYNRERPPLHFTPGPPRPIPNYGRMAREYFRLGVMPGVTHESVMSNGMTMGEMAMSIVRDRNTKRQRNETN